MDDLMQLYGMTCYEDVFKAKVKAQALDKDNSVPDNCVLSLPGLEPKLLVMHADLIPKFDKEVSDDPEFSCYSCEHLFQRKSVTSMKNYDTKFISEV